MKSSTISRQYHHLLEESILGLARFHQSKSPRLQIQSKPIQLFACSYAAASLNNDVIIIVFIITTVVSFIIIIDHAKKRKTLIHAKSSL